MAPITRGRGTPLQHKCRKQAPRKCEHTTEALHNLMDYVFTMKHNRNFLRIKQEKTQLLRQLSADYEVKYDTEVASDRKME